MNSSRAGPSWACVLASVLVRLYSITGLFHGAISIAVASGCVVQADAGAVMARLIVYTAIFGTTPDRLRPPATAALLPDCRFICFSDRERAIGPWEVLPAVQTSSSPRRTARLHKVLAHHVLPAHDVSVWIDGCLAVRTSPLAIVHDALHGTGLSSLYALGTFKHPQRDCVYREHDACRRLKKDDPEIMRRQMEYYQFIGYPMHNGLVESSCLVRRDTEQLRAFNTAWWDLIDRFSCRDQLSFNVVAWKLQMAYGILPGCRDKSLYFSYHPHVFRRVRK